MEEPEEATTATPNKEAVTRTFTWMVAVIEEFRKLNPEMQAQTLLTFCAVASREGEVSMKDVEHLTGMTTSSTSRNVAALGALHRKGQPGMDLVLAFENPMNRRMKLLKLTPKGRRVAESIVRYAGNPIYRRT